MTTRRSFLSQSTAVTTGFCGLQQFFGGKARAASGFSYGELRTDPDGLLDLPEGFQYRILSRTGDLMDDGYKVPGMPDGMAAFDLGNGRLALIRNHEIGHSRFILGPFEDNTRLPDDFPTELSYDPGRHGGQPFVGGTSTLIYDTASGKVQSQYLSLVGTDRNCAGGPTPWGSWVTCEEPADMTTEWGQHHGYCFEVPATAEPGLVEPVPLKAMGRFRHEAIAVDPRTDIVYLTEDRSDGVIYRFLPEERKNLSAGGRLQALKIQGEGDHDTRNWPEGKSSFPIGERVAVEWIDLDDVESPKDDLRLRAIDKGAVIFSRGEGMWYGSPEEVGEHSVYWVCTDGGANQSGQIFRYFPSEAEGTPGESDSPGELELYLEPNDSGLLRNGDNITVAPSGHLYICEDSSGPNRVQGVTPDGQMFAFANNALNDSELAGACFAPDGTTLFVNIMSPGITFAVTGPFA
ncbi:MAG: alkaline phosphatase PhoX [Verrucomicrobiales bacterium]